MNQQSESAQAQAYPDDGRAAVESARAYEAATRGVSVPHLLRQLTGDVTSLFSKEVSLARAEMREAVHDVKTGLMSLTSGSVVLLAGLIVLLMSAVYGLATVLALWLSALIVGGVVTIAGLLMVKSGRSKLSAGSLAPRRTAHAIKEDRDTVRDAVKGGAR